MTDPGDAAEAGWEGTRRWQLRLAAAATALERLEWLEDVKDLYIEVVRGRLAADPAFRPPGDFWPRLAPPAATEVAETSEPERSTPPGD